MPAVLKISLLAAVLLATTPSFAFTIAKEGKPACVIVSQPGATAAEKNAAQDLAATLRNITGAEFQIIAIATGNRVPRAFRTVEGLAIDAGKRFEVVYEAAGVKLRVVAGS